ncbi:MAG TPA: sigma-70 family RNA polymerase sigma factor [Steroidobacteraceae bacterium]|nr:sigma-70 family RNA polymerase sigma factor [Steroidobacteraceae bacterium]
MEAAPARPLTSSQQDRQLARLVRRERGRLLAFIRGWVADAAEAEDILQDTLYELLLAYRMTRPIEQAGAWLMRVARNRIIDRFRRNAVRRVPLSPEADASGAGTVGALEDLLPAALDPETQAMREALLAQVEAALAVLPREQREVFIAHELEGVSFRDLAARSGVGINTLLARKHYATRFLRARLQAAWDDWLTT